MTNEQKQSQWFVLEVDIEYLIPFLNGERIKYYFISVSFILSEDDHFRVIKIVKEMRKSSTNENILR